MRDLQVFNKDGTPVDEKRLNYHSVAAGKFFGRAADHHLALTLRFFDRSTSQPHPSDLRWLEIVSSTYILMGR